MCITPRSNWLFFVSESTSLKNQKFHENLSTTFLVILLTNW